MAKIVAATGTATGAQYTAAEIERAMVQAAEKCAAQGITDPDKIREAKLKARADFKAGKPT